MDEIIEVIPEDVEEEICLEEESYVNVKSEPVTVELDLAEGDQVVRPTGDALFSRVTIKKPEDLESANIVEGHTIANVPGAAHLAVTEEKTVAADFSDGDMVITPTSGTDAMTQVTVTKDVNQNAENIRAGATIAGTAGSFSADATATVGDIVIGKTAGVNGQMVEGTLVPLESEAVTFTRNGTYTAPSGKAYTPVTIDVGHEAPLNDVRLYDYDGRLAYSYSADDFLALTEMPPAPEHDGLISRGWNWSLADAKEYVGKYGILDVGAQYDTDDGTTRIYFTLEDGRLSPILGLAVNGEVDVDWGDGSSHTTMTGSSLSTVVYQQHTYSSEGYYRVKINVISGTAKILGNNNTGGSYLWTDHKLQTNSSDCSYRDRVRKIEIGRNIIAETNTLGIFRHMESIVVTCESINNNKMYISTALDYSIKHLTIPSGVVTVSGSARDMYGLTSISFPKEVAYYDAYLFQYAYLVSRYTLPELSLIPSGLLQNNVAISFIIIPLTVNTLKAAICSGCNSLLSFILLNSVPPVATASNTFLNFPTDCIIYVPVASLASYLTATNYPDPATYTYAGWGKYSSGTELPTVDQTNTYSLTWYATKEDLRSQTNPITVGNGKEVYCRYAAV